MKKIRLPVLIIITLTAVSVLLHICFTLSTSFSDFFNENIAYYFRLALAKLTDIIPFSVAEILLYSTPVLAAVLVIYLNKSGGSIGKRIMEAVRILLSVLAIIYILFVLTFASGYNCSRLDKRLNIEKSDVSAKELYDTLVYVTEKVNEATQSIGYEEDGSSKLPYNYSKLSDKLCESYKSVYSEYSLGESFESDIKPLFISPLMTYTHISGIYSFFTGEANMNTNFPDYVCAFSAAHELAHQRGISREDEANFMAYLVCVESDNEYLRYSGYLSMFNYLSSALKKADYELYTEAVAPLCSEARGEIAAYSLFFNKYRDSTASKVSDAVNDTYLKSQGTAGVQSYGMAVDLAVAFHRNDI